MNEPHDLNRTVDVPSAPADSLDAGLAAGFGGPRSSLGASQRPVLLREAQGESAHVVRPNSDAMPKKNEAGDRYQLFGEIARGGMGAVLRGRDVDLGRDLAVKVLLEKHADRPEVARRFIEEAQVGAQLQHPGVVPVYDIGRFGDRPFFTMKLVKGQTLAALLGERADVTADRPRLLGDFLKVCQAVAYAHAKGVIHRDLKPANVMVGAFGEVQVMDWGLAKVLAEGGVADEERAASRGRERPEVGTVIRTARSAGSKGGFGTDTEAGSLLGTPAYMPPEQATGDVTLLDRRADVFGLGAILCEILTGKPPYVGRSAEEVRRKAANGDLADALTRLDGCGADGELVALTKACLAPEAIDRPRDAQAVADALTAYLDGVQERLRRAELAEAAATARAAEEAKRRRLTVALAATVLLAVTLGGGGWLWVKADRDARRDQVAREVNDALSKATALSEQAKAATAGGAALFAQAREQAQRALALVESGPVDAALEGRVRQLQAELDEEERDQRFLAAIDAARLAQAVTLAGENRFAPERAVPLYQEAFRTYGLPPGEGEPAAVADRIRRRPAAVREAAVTALDSWLEIATTPKFHLAEPHLSWLQAVLEAAEPQDAWTRRFRAARDEKDKEKRYIALERLAAEADVEKLPVQALERLARRLRPEPEVELLRRAQRRHPADFWVNHVLGEAVRQVTPPQHAEAVRFLSVAVALRPDSPGAHLNLGNALDRAGQNDEAIACYRKAIELDPKYAMAHTNLGTALRVKGLVDDAIVCHRKAIALDPKHAVFHHNLGIALHREGQVDEAIACYRKAIELDPGNATFHGNLGPALRAKGQVDEGIACIRKVIELDPKHARGYNNLGAILCDDKRDYDNAIACFRRAVELDPKMAHPHVGLGNALGHKGQLDEAIACYRKALALDPKNAHAYLNLGVALRDNGRLDEAIVYFRKAVELDPKYAQGYNVLGLALHTKGQVDEAIACFRRAFELDPKHAHAPGNLGIALGAKGRLDEAVVIFRRNLELHPKSVGARGLLAQTERAAAVQGKLPDLRKGECRPSDNAERLALADLCCVRMLNRTGAGLYADAFAADPGLAIDWKARHRFKAACCAALAVAGQGEDAAKLNDGERQALRRQALTWAFGELALLRRRLAGSSADDLDEVREQLRDWQGDSDLASLRAPAALAKLPAEERAACVRLWADVAALLKKAEVSMTREGNQ